MNSSLSSSAFAAIALLMFATGIGIPIMAALNANLGQQIGSPATATAVIFAGGFLISALALIVTGVPPMRSFANVQPYFYIGAVFILFYIYSITWAAPHVGVGNAVFFVLLGQMVAAALIDHFGWLGAIQTLITPRRVVGLMVMTVGVYLARRT